MDLIVSILANAAGLVRRAVLREPPEPSSRSNACLPAGGLATEAEVADRAIYEREMFGIMALSATYKDDNKSTAGVVNRGQPFMTVAAVRARPGTCFLLSSPCLLLAFGADMEWSGCISQCSSRFHHWLSLRPRRSGRTPVRWTDSPVRWIDLDSASAVGAGPPTVRR